MWISSSFYVYLTPIDFTDMSAFRRIPPIFHNLKTPLPSAWSPDGRPPSSPFFPAFHRLQASFRLKCPFCSSFQLHHKPSRSKIALFSDHCNYFVFSLLQNEYFSVPLYLSHQYMLLLSLDSRGQEDCLVSLLYCCVHLALRINQRLPHPVCIRTFPQIKKKKKIIM